MGGRASLCLVVVLFLHGLAGCTRRTEGYCCSSAEQCADVGGVVAQCPSGQLCDDDGSLASGPAHTCIPDPDVQPCSDPNECVAPTPACVDDICVECDGDAHCESPTAPVCDLGLHRCSDCSGPSDCERFEGHPYCAPFGACTECLPEDPVAESVDCETDTPICGADGACRACTDHRECATGACDLATGACVEAAQIAYVEFMASAANTTCSPTSRCDTVGKALLTGRPFIVIAPTPDTEPYAEDISIMNRDVVLIGYGARFTALLNNSPALAVTGTGSDVAAYGITFENSDSGVDCYVTPGNNASITLVDVASVDHDQLGIHSSECDLVIARSRVSRNAGGGIQAQTSRVDITNTIIDGNGTATAVVGGVELDRPKPGSRFAFNTITDNVTQSVLPGGIACDSLSATPAFHSNIVFANLGAAAQVNGQPECVYEYSLVIPEISGTGNISGDPALDGEYRLTSGSAAIGAANPDSQAIVPDDIDRQVRPHDAPDIGADEFYP
jgi:hypothetical protein